MDGVMPDWVAVIMLGLIEGITEFLPVSSTGHLLIAEHWLPRQSDLFNVGIQSGAVLAVLVLFHGRVRSILTQWRAPASRDYGLKLLLAFAVTSAGGLILKKAGFELPETAAPVAWATLIGGGIILGLERALKGRPLGESITWPMAVAAGLAQILAAVFPGTSRSGATILTVLAMGLNRPMAAEFSFLLGIPTLISAGALQCAHALSEGGVAESWWLLLLGTVVSAVTAFAAVKWLLRFVQSHTFNGFGWYRIGLGLLILWAAR